MPGQPDPKAPKLFGQEVHAHKRRKVKGDGRSAMYAKGKGTRLGHTHYDYDDPSSSDYGHIDQTPVIEEHESHKRTGKSFLGDIKLRLMTYVDGVEYGSEAYGALSDDKTEAIVRLENAVNYLGTRIEVPFVETGENIQSICTKKSIDPEVLEINVQLNKAVDKAYKKYKSKILKGKTKDYEKAVISAHIEASHKMASFFGAKFSELNHTERNPEKGLNEIYTAANYLTWMEGRPVVSTASKHDVKGKEVFIEHFDRPVRFVTKDQAKEMLNTYSDKSQPLWFKMLSEKDQDGYKFMVGNTLSRMIDVNENLLQGRKELDRNIKDYIGSIIRQFGETNEGESLKSLPLSDIINELKEPYPKGFDKDTIHRALLEAFITQNRINHVHTNSLATFQRLAGQSISDQPTLQGKYAGSRNLSHVVDVVRDAQGNILNYSSAIRSGTPHPHGVKAKALLKLKGPDGKPLYKKSEAEKAVKLEQVRIYKENMKQEIIGAIHAEYDFYSKNYKEMNKYFKLGDTAPKMDFQKFMAVKYKKWTGGQNSYFIPYNITELYSGFKSSERKFSKTRAQALKELKEQDSFEIPSPVKGSKGVNFSTKNCGSTKRPVNIARGGSKSTNPKDAHILGRLTREEILAKSDKPSQYLASLVEMRENLKTPYENRTKTNSVWAFLKQKLGLNPYKDNEELKLAAVESLIKSEIGCIEAGGCKSGKDRKGFEQAMRQAIIKFIVEYPTITPPIHYSDEKSLKGDDLKYYKAFKEIVAKEVMNGYQQKMAEMNAPGVRGQKNFKDIIPKDIIKTVEALEKQLINSKALDFSKIKSTAGGICERSGTTQSNSLAKTNKPEFKKISSKFFSKFKKSKTVAPIYETAPEAATGLPEGNPMSATKHSAGPAVKTEKKPVRIGNRNAANYDILSQVGRIEENRHRPLGQGKPSTKVPIPAVYSIPLILGQSETEQAIEVLNDPNINIKAYLSVLEEKKDGTFEKIKSFLTSPLVPITPQGIKLLEAITVFENTQLRGKKVLPQKGAFEEVPFFAPGFAKKAHPTAQDKLHAMFEGGKFKENFKLISATDLYQLELSDLQEIQAHIPNEYFDIEKAGAPFKKYNAIAPKPNLNEEDYKNLIDLQRLTNTVIALKQPGKNTLETSRFHHKRAMHYFEDLVAAHDSPTNAFQLKDAELQKISTLLATLENKKNACRLVALNPASTIKEKYIAIDYLQHAHPDELNEEDQTFMTNMKVFFEQGNKLTKDNLPIEPLKPLELNAKQKAALLAEELTLMEGKVPKHK